jgi:hypothetical protein
LHGLIQYYLCHRHNLVSEKQFHPVQIKILIIKKINCHITSSEAGKRRSLSAGGVIARGPRRSGGGVFSLSIVFHISAIFFALPMFLYVSYDIFFLSLSFY